MRFARTFPKLVFDLDRYVVYISVSLILSRVQIVDPTGLCSMDLQWLFGCWVILYALIGYASKSRLKGFVF